MDNPRIFLGSSAEQAKLVQALTRADPEDINILDGRDDGKRATLIAERLGDWKTIKNV